MSDLDPEMIEKVAIATYEEMQRPNWHAPLWDEIDEPGQERFLNAARAALRSVAPLIAAQTLRDAVNELRRLDDGRSGGYYDAGRHIIKRLDARADEIERGES